MYRSSLREKQRAGNPVTRKLLFDHPRDGSMSSCGARLFRVMLLYLRGRFVGFVFLGVVDGGGRIRNLLRLQEGIRGC